MSGKYAGMQAKLKERNAFIHYAPCAAHSLNLVEQAAASCCGEEVSFFGFGQQLYNLFSASTSRWMILKESFNDNIECLVPKSMSDTRWSANADAVSR